MRSPRLRFTVRCSLATQCKIKLSCEFAASRPFVRTSCTNESSLTFLCSFGLRLDGIPDMASRTNEPNVLDLCKITHCPFYKFDKNGRFRHFFAHEPSRRVKLSRAGSLACKLGGCAGHLVSRLVRHFATPSEPSTSATSATNARATRAKQRKQAPDSNSSSSPQASLPPFATLISPCGPRLARAWRTLRPSSLGTRSTSRTSMGILCLYVCDSCYVFVAWATLEQCAVS